MLSRLLSTLILLLASTLGVWAFLSPFFASRHDPGSMESSQAASAPVLFLTLLALCLVVIIANLETKRMDSRWVAVLGLVVGLNSVLRMFTGPGGFNAVFFLPIVCGYVLGADFGFLVGALSILVSAFLTSGVGPWLPFQMFATGWSGMVAGWLPRLPKRIETPALALWGALSGYGVGAIMNLWFWPYLAVPDAGPPGSAMHWAPGVGLAQTLRRYSIFYFTTSFWWDTARAAGNVAILLAVAPPVIRLLRRFQDRFHFWIETLQ
jgi:energy-coupling factor transport system substrate-specific component